MQMPDRNGSAVHVLAVGVAPSVGLDACVSRPTADGGNALRVDHVDAAQLESALTRLPAATRRVALVDANDAAGATTRLIAELRCRWPELPVIVLARTAGPDDVCRWFEMGATDYVTPPITRTALLPRLLRLAAPAHLGVHCRDAQMGGFRNL